MLTTQQKEGLKEIDNSLKNFLDVSIEGIRNHASFLDINHAEVSLLMSMLESKGPLAQQAKALFARIKASIIEEVKAMKDRRAALEIIGRALGRISDDEGNRHPLYRVVTQHTGYKKFGNTTTQTTLENLETEYAAAMAKERGASAEILAGELVKIKKLADKSPVEALEKLEEIISQKKGPRTQHSQLSGLFAYHKKQLGNKGVTKMMEDYAEKLRLIVKNEYAAAPVPAPASAEAKEDDIKERDRVSAGVLSSKNSVDFRAGSSGSVLDAKVEPEKADANDLDQRDRSLSECFV